MPYDHRTHVRAADETDFQAMREAYDAVAPDPAHFDVHEFPGWSDGFHVARVRAATAVQGFAISRHDFDSLLDSDPRIALGLLRVLARRLVATDRLLSDG